MKILTIILFLSSLTIIFGELIMGYARYQQPSSHKFAMLDIFSSFKI